MFRLCKRKEKSILNGFYSTENIHNSISKFLIKNSLKKSPSIHYHDLFYSLVSLNMKSKQFMSFFSSNFSIQKFLQSESKTGCTDEGANSGNVWIITTRYPGVVSK